MRRIARLGGQYHALHRFDRLLEYSVLVEGGDQSPAKSLLNLLTALVRGMGESERQHKGVLEAISKIENKATCPRLAVEHRHVRRDPQRPQRRPGHAVAQIISVIDQPVNHLGRLIVAALRRGRPASARVSPKDILLRRARLSIRISGGFRRRRSLGERRVT